MNNITWHEHKIQKENRETLLQQKGTLIWFTGLSGSGKSTIAGALEEALHEKAKATYLLDGDNVRTGLNKNLSFSEDDRTENIRRVGEVGKLFTDAGIICLAAFISPFEKDRAIVRERNLENFIEVFVDANLDVCEERDPKGLYKKARNGEIKNMTGIDSKYEIPQNPEIIVNTNQDTVEACVEKILKYLQKQLII